MSKDAPPPAQVSLDRIAKLLEALLRVQLVTTKLQAKLGQVSQQEVLLETERARDLLGDSE